MKKSQLVSIITTLALALCMAFMPALCACSNSTGQDAVQAQAGDDGSSVEAEGGQDNAGSVALNMEDNSPSSDPDSADDPEDAISAGQDEDDADAVTSAPSDSEDASDSGEVVSSSTDGGQDDAAATSPESDGKEDASQTTSSSGASKLKVTEDGWYTSKEEVALYIHTYKHLPGNFISKTKARAAGWVAKEGNLDEACPGMSIGGSVYYNEGWDGEELLPEARGRTWKECDINYHGGYRGAERLVFSNDGLIFYTDDHYQTFEQLY